MGTVRVVWSPSYEVDIGRHVFPTAKYRLVRDRLLADGVIEPGDLVEAQPASDADLLRVHHARYLDKVRNDCFSPHERFELEVPFSKALAVASRIACGGTLLTARLALTDGVAVHLGGGFHHAFADHGEGFCVLNDVAVAAATLLDEGAVAQVMVIDLDVHQGNGTASVFSREPRVFTLSMHQQRNYPYEKPPSDLDLGLLDGTGDEGYLGLLRANLPVVVARARPQLAFYLAGADPYQEDQLGGLALSKEGLRARDAFVLETLRDAGVATAVVLAGGYALCPEDTVAIHAGTVAACAEEVRTVRR
jgi:acetoin utilization deacetylase AcuC-like enzyme